MENVPCSCGCGEFIPAGQLFRYRSPYFLRGHNAPPKPCACGCGQPIANTLNARYHDMRYLRGHQNKVANESPKPCGCGCGGLTTVRKGRALDFITGHNQRGRNWGKGFTYNAGGYRLVLKPDHPVGKRMKGYVLEHRVVMEESLGRLLERWEHVHHVNGIKDDNRLENLQLVHIREHGKMHGRGHSAKD